MPKKGTKSQKKVDQAMREVHAYEPAAVKKTRARKGAAAAERQKKAIGLDKARKAGARIPRK